MEKIKRIMLNLQFGNEEDNFKRNNYMQNTDFETKDSNKFSNLLTNYYPDLSENNFDYRYNTQLSEQNFNELMTENKRKSFKNFHNSQNYFNSSYSTLKLLEKNNIDFILNKQSFQNPIEKLILSQNKEFISKNHISNYLNYSERFYSQENKKKTFSNSLKFFNLKNNRYFIQKIFYFLIKKKKSEPKIISKIKCLRKDLFTPTDSTKFIIHPLKYSNTTTPYVN